MGRVGWDFRDYLPLFYMDGLEDIGRRSFRWGGCRQLTTILFLVSCVTAAVCQSTIAPTENENNEHGRIPDIHLPLLYTEYIHRPRCLGPRDQEITGHVKTQRYPSNFELTLRKLWM